MYLQYLPYFTATASKAGYTWWSHDIGGHMNGLKDDELYVRFVQFGVFNPVNRLRSTKNNTFSKMPDCYKNGAREIVKNFLRLRHSMIPFLYSAVCENVEKGLALIEPMYYAYPHQEDAYNCPGQYLFGRELIVAPITEKSRSYHMSSVNVWLPEGIWTDIFTGHTYQGGKWSIPGQDNTQTVRFHSDDPGNLLPVRSYVLEFRNIADGEVTVLEDGREKNCRVSHRNGYTRVHLEQARPNTDYEIKVCERKSPLSRRNTHLQRNISLLEGDNGEKAALADALCKETDNVTCGKILECSAIPQIFKDFLCEILG